MSALTFNNSMNPMPAIQIELGPPERSTEVAIAAAVRDKTVLISNRNQDRPNYIHDVNEFYCSFGQIVRQNGHRVDEDFELFTLLCTTKTELALMEENLHAIRDFAPRLCVLTGIDSCLDFGESSVSGENIHTLKGNVISEPAFYRRITDVLSAYGANIRTWNAGASPAAHFGTEHVAVESIIEFPKRFVLAEMEDELIGLGDSFGGTLELEKGITL